VRTVAILIVASAFVGAACAKKPAFGPLGDAASLHPRITAVDTAIPPRAAWIELDQPSYVALLLVAPGHSATLLYQRDSATNNQLGAGAHHLTYDLPGFVAVADSLRDPARRRQMDSTRRGMGGGRMRNRADSLMLPPLPPMTQVSLLLVTSPQPLTYKRIRGVTSGVSIPTIEEEALNAVGKAIKSTIATEPREWAGYYQHVTLLRP
jgi:hypothetical protein